MSPSMNSPLPDIRSLDRAGLQDAVAALGEKPFRAKQLEAWIWTKAAQYLRSHHSVHHDLRRVLKHNLVSADERSPTKGVAPGEHGDHGSGE